MKNIKEETELAMAMPLLEKDEQIDRIMRFDCPIASMSNIRKNLYHFDPKTLESMKSMTSVLLGFINHGRALDKAASREDYTLLWESSHWTFSRVNTRSESMALGVVYNNCLNNTFVDFDDYTEMDEGVYILTAKASGKVKAFYTELFNYDVAAEGPSNSILSDKVSAVLLRAITLSELPLSQTVCYRMGYVDVECILDHIDRKHTVVTNGHYVRFTAFKNIVFLDTVPLGYAEIIESMVGQIRSSIYREEELASLINYDYLRSLSDDNRDGRITVMKSFGCVMIDLNASDRFDLSMEELHSNHLLYVGDNCEVTIAIQPPNYLTLIVGSDNTVTTSEINPIKFIGYANTVLRDDNVIYKKEES